MTTMNDDFDSVVAEVAESANTLTGLATGAVSELVKARQEVGRLMLENYRMASLLSVKETECVFLRGQVVEGNFRLESQQRKLNELRRETGALYERYRCLSEELVQERTLTAALTEQIETAAAEADDE